MHQGRTVEIEGGGVHRQVGPLHDERVAGLQVADGQGYLRWRWRSRDRYCVIGYWIISGTCIAVQKRRPADGEEKDEQRESEPADHRKEEFFGHSFFFILANRPIWYIETRSIFEMGAKNALVIALVFGRFHHHGTAHDDIPAAARYARAA